MTRPVPTPPPTAAGTPRPTAADTVPAALPGAWAGLAAVSLGLFLAVLSTTVVSVALPTIGTDLPAGPTALEWVVDAYVLVYAGLLVPGGVLGDRHGHKGVFLVGTALFGLGALINGLAPSVPVLLAGRVVQGLGPALLVPGSLAVIRTAFPDARLRARAIGLWSTSSGLALAAGPPLGGVLVDGLGWRWVFLVNVPAAGVLLLLTARFMPRVPAARTAARFDAVGAVLSVAAVALPALAVIEGQDHGWTAAPVLAGFAAGAAALVGFTGWELRRREPLIDVRLFGRPVFTAAILASAVSFFAFVGAIVYISAFFQRVQGHTPVRAGLDVAAIGVGFALAAWGCGRLIARVGERIPLVAGLVLAGAAMLGLLRLRPDTGQAAVWWDFALLGVGVGLAGTPTSTVAMSAVEAARAGMASAVLNALRQVGQVFGVAVLGALVYADLPHGAAGGRLSAADAARFTAGLHRAVGVGGFALLGVAALSAGLVLRDRAARNRTGDTKA